MWARLLACVACALWMACSLGQAQSDLVIHWVDATGLPAPQTTRLGHTLHVGAWIDGVTQSTVQGQDLVVDDEGWCAWPEVPSGVYVLESLPWEWVLVVDNALPGIDTVTLVVPEALPAKLRGNTGVVKYQVDHPGTAIDEVQAWVRADLDSLDLDQLMATGAVGSSEEARNEASQNLRAALDSGRGQWRTFADRFRPNTLWGDLFAYECMAWQMSLGAQAHEFDPFLEDTPADPRSMAEQLVSPGWCESWRLKSEGWPDRLAEQDMPWKRWVGYGQTDSLSQALGWSVNEVHLTLWMASDEQPRGAFKAWWEARWRDQCDVAEARRLAEQTQRYPRTAQSWGDLMWMMPNGDIEPAWASESDSRWFVWLVVKDGSSTAMRERAVLRSFMERLDTRQVGWGVLSVDDSNEGWKRTLSDRMSTKERVQWVGRDPAWWDRLQLQGVPQVVLVKPDGTIATHQARLPSEGLLADLQRTLNKRGARRP